MGLLEGSNPAPPKFLDAEDEEMKTIVPNSPYDTWIMRDQQVASFLVNSLSEDVLPHVFGLAYVVGVWHALNELYSSQSKSRVSTIRGSLTNTKKLRHDNATTHLQNERYTYEVVADGKLVDDDKLKEYILNGPCRYLFDGTSEEGFSRVGEEVGAIRRRVLGTMVRDLPSFRTPARWQGLLLLVWNYLGAFALLQ
jgi:hypothetical protein